MTETCKLLGVEMNAVCIEDLIDFIRSSIDCDNKRIIGNHNLHSIYIYHNDSKIREFYRRVDLTVIDGMPLVFLGKFLGLPLSKSHRHTCLDWIKVLLREAEINGWNVFSLGSKSEVIAKAAEKLKNNFPDLRLQCHHGFFDAEPSSDENRKVVNEINSVKPQILLVGMGMPRQEHWILDNYDELQANIILPVGAYMAYIGEAIPTPPRWMGKIGLEWLFRLVSEPRRLFRRYLIEPWFVLGVLITGREADSPKDLAE